MKDDRAIAAVRRVTGGSFRPLQRPFNQIGHIPTIDEITTITEDIVWAARSTLAIWAN